MKIFKWILLIAVFTGMLYAYGAAPEHTFKQIMISETTYKIGYFYRGKFQKYVAKNKPAYVKFAKSNAVAVVPYVAPPAPKPATLDSLKIRAVNKVESDKRSEFEEALWKASNQYTELQALKVSIQKATTEQQIKDLIK